LFGTRHAALNAERTAMAHLRQFAKAETGNNLDKEV